MTNDFLQSSPSRNLIDPVIYNFNDNQQDKSNDSHHAPTSSTQHKSTLTPSGVKFHDNNNLSGWTPLITKTMFTDQVPSFNSTPNRFLVTTQPNGEYDYSQGLNLTPFLNQNMGIINSNQSASQNITPFHDKTLQLTDFFIDSPIKHSSSKDLDSGTSSISRIVGDKHNSKQLAQNKVVQKRSITQLDTPQRQPHKLSVISKPDQEEDDDDEEKEDNENELVDKKNEVKKEFFQTPSKGPLKDISNKTKTPNILGKPKEFTTPAQPTEKSSPSTVIMSSAIRSPENKAQIPLNEPQSPTPLKEKLKMNNLEESQRLIPVMGVFSEKKTKPLPKTDATKLSSGYINNGTNGTKNNKAQMQAGMNKFQIVFTDVHTLMNNKSKTKKLNNKQKKNQLDANDMKNENKLLKTNFVDQSETLGLPQVASKQSSQSSSIYGTQSQSAPSIQDHNTSMNSTKELSIISGNSSHFNLTTNTDHMSFDMGGLSSTPNSKYLLDKMLEKPSPQSQNMLNQVNYYMQQQFYSMPPPNKQQEHQMTGPQFQQHQQAMMMMMSTPQHQHTLNYGNLYHSNNDISPTSNHNDSISDRHINFQ